MAAQAGLCLAWSETPEDTFCRVVAQRQQQSNTVIVEYNHYKKKSEGLFKFCIPNMCNNTMCAINKFVIVIIFD